MNIFLFSDFYFGFLQTFFLTFIHKMITKWLLWAPHPYKPQQSRNERNYLVMIGDTLQRCLPFLLQLLYNWSHGSEIFRIPLEFHSRKGKGSDTHANQGYNLFPRQKFHTLWDHCGGEVGAETRWASDGQNHRTTKLFIHLDICLNWNLLLVPLFTVPLYMLLFPVCPC